MTQFISPEKELLLRLKNNQHTKNCQAYPQIMVSECLCFQFALDQILSTPKTTLKKRTRKQKTIHWEKYNCGTKNRQTTNILKDVSCGHCQKSKDYQFAIQKFSLAS